MGIAGSAYGTIISQTLSVVLVIIFFNRTNPMTRIKLKELKLNIVTAKEILTLGMPTSIQQASVSIGSMVVMGYINSYGTAAIAGFATGDRVDILVYATIMSLSLAMTSYTGQNVGAGSMERVNLGVKQGLTLSLIFGAFFSSILLIFSRQFLSLFTTDAQTIAEAMKYLIIIVPSYLFMAISQPLSGIMRGSGETVIPMISSLITVLIVRLPLVFLFNHLLGKIEGVYYAQFAAQVTGCVYLFIAYRRGKWRRRALIKIDSLYNAESADSTE
jgi:putative MATE family efflux protein